MNFSVKTLAKILALSAGCSLVTLSQAANTITFNGKVSDTTCTATIDNGVSSIEMGTSSVDELDKHTYGAAKSFSFKLTGCPKTTDGGNDVARVTFGGEADTTNSDYFRNQATDSPATGVAVAIFDNKGALLKNNTEGADVDITSGTATIPFTVKLAKSGTNAPTKGAVQTTVTYNVTYY
ncbi:fimbrial protein [Klebsiella michiganensis]|uniref:fimbrial protein n=1 Tax=Klebsiella michiganensis TaxID=1134687 RepID=UPI0015FAE227|nr:fimbrial protein [Klebsiella michiganensis]MBS0928780.1 fimbrial protein [Klebsiella michiganensis]MCX3081895.1 fimbrial protein [Klebsiella michiganensis]MCY0822079.1 fimbrial protein [Klebsiella michiganensis]